MLPILYMNIKNNTHAPMATKTARGCTANIPKFRVAKATAPHRHVYTSPMALTFFGDSQSPKKPPWKT